jgi:hypothetical protein
MISTWVPAYDIRYLQLARRSPFYLCTSISRAAVISEQSSKIRKLFPLLSGSKFRFKLEFLRRVHGILVPVRRVFGETSLGSWDGGLKITPAWLLGG